MLIQPVRNCRIYNNESYNDNVISFGNRKLLTAEKALEALEKHAESGTLIGLKDEKWLVPLRRFFGTKKITVNNPNNPKELMDVNCELTADKINNGNGMLSLMNALKAMIAATRYTPKRVRLGGFTYSVHNRALAGLLKSEYNQENFSELFRYLNKEHVFDMTDNVNYGLIIDKERGIAKTCGATENWEMSD